jgi:hypothetical protein
MRALIAVILAFFAGVDARAFPTQLEFDPAEAIRVFDPEAAYDFRGIVKLSNCSGSLVRFQGAKDSDPGLVMTNGHCVSVGGGMIPANRFLYRQPSKRTFQLLDRDGSIQVGEITASELIYATITWNDVAIYALNESYEQVRRRFGVEALLLDANRPVLGDSIEILSGYWQRGYSCTIDRFVHELREASYVSRDSMRYSKGGCQTIHGTSGSPILNQRTRLVVGINSTGSDRGERCTMNNPCEVSESGEIYVEKGRSYGDQTHVLYSCLNRDGKIDLTVSGCKLFRQQ